MLAESEFFPLLVSPEWLMAHLNDHDVVVIDGSFHLPTAGRDVKSEFEAAHIPGAVLFDLDEIADHSTDLPHMLPDASSFAKAMGELGIHENMHAVVYDTVGLFSAPRVWWTLRTFGMKRVSVLDGGFPLWQQVGGAIEAGSVTRSPQRFVPHFDNARVVTAHQVLSEVEMGQTQIVDARPAIRFRGEAAEPRPGVRSGRIPGSRNVPSSLLSQDGRLKTRTELTALFKEAGVSIGEPVITSCGSGVTAAALTFALICLDAPEGAVYDGSWAEWGARADLPIAIGDD